MIKHAIYQRTVCWLFSKIVVHVSFFTHGRKSSHFFQHQAQQHSYHVVSAAPKVEGVCDIDGSELYQRSDDSAETARRRLQVFTEQTAPLVDYYQGKGLLTAVDGERSIEDVGKELSTVLQ